MKLVIFDCDGTLVDSQHLIVAAMARAFESNGMAALPSRKVLSIVGLSLPLAIERLLPDAPADQIASVCDGYRAAFGDLRRDPAHHEPLYPGMLDLIHALSGREDVLLGIATGKSIRGVQALFDRMSLADHFFTVQTADTHPSKPHPSMIERAMADAGAHPDDTVMIGDTTFDIEMAHHASVGALGVAWGYHPAEALKAVGAHSVSDDAASLHEAIGFRLGFGSKGREELAVE